MRLAGSPHADVATDTEWLASLDRFGIVTERAVLLDGMTLAANLALPLTLEIDPIPADVLGSIGWRSWSDSTRRARPDGDERSSPSDRMRLHLARALAVGPQALLLEHPTASLDGARRAEFGADDPAVSATVNSPWSRLQTTTRSPEPREGPASGEGVDRELVRKTDSGAGCLRLHDDAAGGSRSAAQAGLRFAGDALIGIRVHDDRRAVGVEERQRTGDRVTRVVITVIVAWPFASATRFGRSPMWNG